MDLDVFSLELSTQYKVGKTKMLLVWLLGIISSLFFCLLAFAASHNTSRTASLSSTGASQYRPPTSRGLDERRRDHGHHHGQVSMLLAAGHGGGRRAGGFRDAVPRRWQRRRAADSVRGAVAALGRRRDFWQQVFWTREKNQQQQRYRQKVSFRFRTQTPQ